MPFKPGQSGNPGGHSRKAEALRKALECLSDDAGKRMKQLIKSEDEMVAFKACECVIKHVKGMPRQEVTGADGTALMGILVLPAETDEEK